MIKLEKCFNCNERAYRKKENSFDNFGIFPDYYIIYCKKCGAEVSWPTFSRSYKKRYYQFFKDYKEIAANKWNEKQRGLKNE